MSQSFKRARKPEEKEKRRALLLSVAKKMLARDPDLNALSLNELARNSKMAKSNVYRYFETREALLLAILMEEWAEWLSDLKKDLKPGKVNVDLPGVVRQVARTLSERQILCALTAALPSVVERNLSEEAIRGFKLASLEVLGECGKWLESCCPSLDAKEYTRLVYDGACLMAGIYPHANPSKAVAKVLKSPQLAFFRHDFSTDLERVMIALAVQMQKLRAKRDE